MEAEFNANVVSNAEMIKRICNGIIADIAPEELIIVNQVVDNIIANLIEAEKNSDNFNHNADTPLGFGGNEELYTAILVPIIINTLSKIITAISEGNLKQALNTIQGSKDKQGLKIEITINEFKQEIIVQASRKKLTQRKAKIIADKLLRLIAQELSK